MTQISAEKGGLAVAELPVAETQESPGDLLAKDQLETLKLDSRFDERCDVTSDALGRVNRQFPVVILHLSAIDLRSVLRTFPVAEARIIEDTKLLGQTYDDRSVQLAGIIVRRLIHNGNLRSTTLEDYPLITQLHDLCGKLCESLPRRLFEDRDPESEGNGFIGIAQALLTTRLALETVLPIKEDTSSDFDQHFRRLRACRRMWGLVKGEIKQEFLGGTIREEEAYLERRYSDRKAEYQESNGKKTLGSGDLLGGVGYRSQAEVLGWADSGDDGWTRTPKERRG